MFHQWVGSAGALGYMELAEKARAAETLLDTPGWTKGDLRETLTALAPFAAPREAADTPIPDSIVQELTRKRIALIGFADEEAERLCGAFERVRALPRLFSGEEPPAFGFDSRLQRDHGSRARRRRWALRGCRAGFRARPWCWWGAAKICWPCRRTCRRGLASS